MKPYNKVDNVNITLLHISCYSDIRLDFIQTEIKVQLMTSSDTLQFLVSTSTNTKALCLKLGLGLSKSYCPQKPSLMPAIKELDAGERQKRRAELASARAARARKRSQDEAAVMQVAAGRKRSQDEAAVMQVAAGRRKDKAKKPRIQR